MLYFVINHYAALPGVKNWQGYSGQP